jgi:hypothetical protein
MRTRFATRALKTSQKSCEIGPFSRCRPALTEKIPQKDSDFYSADLAVLLADSRRELSSPLSLLGPVYQTAFYR